MYTPVAYTNIQDDVILERQLPERLEVAAGQPIELVYKYGFMESKLQQDMELEMAASIGDQGPRPVRVNRSDRWGIYDEEFGTIRQVVTVHEPGTYELVVGVKATCKAGPWGGKQKKFEEVDEYRALVHVHAEREFI